MKLVPIVQHSLAYNPRIDALRGIAVSLVVLFHIWPSYFSFGYVGVDIFFVISGFLITQIIYTNLENNKFSLLKFYRNRIRRIFPSLIASLLFLLILGYIFFFPSEFEQLGKHIQSSSFFYENFQLIRETGYWDEAAHLKPLLHCWSLAIEEQFYIFWPLLLFILYKLKLNNIFVFSLLCVFLFILPNIIDVNKFYNILSRAWQLGFGGYAFIVIYYFKLLPKKLGNIYIYIYILFSISILLSYNNQQYSLVKTLFVVFGTMTILIVLSDMNFETSFFSNKLLVFVGLISYPFYLVHYIIISFFHIVGINVSSHGFFIITLSIVLSFLLYRFIEIYARKQEGYKFSIILFLTIICIGMTGHFVTKSHGLPERKHFQSINNYLEKQFKPREQDVDARKLGIQLISQVLNFVPKNNYIQSTSNIISKKFILITGDSHALSSYPGFAQEFKKLGYETLLLANMSCPPYKNGAMDTTLEKLKICQEKIDTIYSLVTSNLRIEKVIFATRMSYMYDHGFGRVEEQYNFHYNDFFENIKYKEDHKKKFFRAIEDTFLFFDNKADIEFFYLMENPSLGFYPKSCTPRPFILGRKCVLNVDLYMNWSGEYRDFISELNKKYRRIKVLDPKPFYCDDKYCYAMRNNKMLYADDDHHSLDGSIEQAKYFLRDIFPSSAHNIQD